MYKIDETIPGWSSKTKLEKLAQLAFNVKENGLIVEIGSFNGRSAYALGMNKKDSVTLLCVDIFTPEWVSSVMVKDYPGTETCYGDTNQIHSYERFCINVSEVNNLQTARMRLPYNDNFFKFIKEIDLLFIDATHTYDAVKADIDQWCQYLKSDGVVVFDDYFDAFPGCIRAVNEYVEKNNLLMEVTEHCAIVRNPGDNR